MIVKADPRLRGRSARDTHEVARRVGQMRGLDLAGKVVLCTSHSHCSSQYTTNSIPSGSAWRGNASTFERIERPRRRVALDALDDLRPARLGILRTTRTSIPRIACDA
ncbi:MAG: hypothetical protein H6721_07025 [Sandaracinus sp.]|nr:hypothetical protein [Sandaracinus sp.]